MSGVHMISASLTYPDLFTAALLAHLEDRPLPAFLVGDLRTGTSRSTETSSATGQSDQLLQRA